MIAAAMERAIRLTQEWERRNTSWSAELNRPMLVFALDAIGAKVDDSSAILDLGCADGHMTGIFAQTASRAVGIDVSFDFVRRAADAQPEGSFACAEAERLPFRDRSFDVVYVGSVFQYTEREAALRDCARVLRSGGLLVSIENLQGSPFARAARAFIALTGRAYPAHQTPRRHLRLEEAGLYLRHFTSMEWRVFNLTTLPPFLAARLLRRRTLFPRGLYDFFHAADQRLFRAVRGLKSLAWHIVICARR